MKYLREKNHRQMHCGPEDDVRRSEYSPLMSMCHAVGQMVGWVMALLTEIRSYSAFRVRNYFEKYI